eukprot:TRINITY_DN3972_c0_g1_i1.p1 TRINITY_DN3972_c0_g1~~TRINITY_DN3972_c0_g1_i1.p1  ORF type:complete len:345 (-),score=39.21 TRINITY_DN3972_c0_g1_i1:178-1173(-)
MALIEKHGGKLGLKKKKRSDDEETISLHTCQKVTKKNPSKSSDDEETISLQASLKERISPKERSLDRVPILNESFRKSSDCRYTNILYANNKWVWIKNNYVPMGFSQLIVTVQTEPCPMEKIKQISRQGYVLKQIEYGDGLWIITADNLTDDHFTTTKQTFYCKQSPQEAVKEAWDKGERVVYLTHYTDYWLVIAERQTKRGTSNSGEPKSSEKDSVQQLITINSTLESMMNELRLFWSRKSNNLKPKISSFCYGNKAWVALSEPNLRHIKQKMYGGTRFPREKFKTAHSEGRSIQVLTYGEFHNMWAMLSATPLGSNRQRVFKERNFIIN